MDPFFNGLSPDLSNNNDFELNHENISANSDQYLNFTNGFKFEDDSLDLNFLDLPFTPSDLESGKSDPSTASYSALDLPFTPSDLDSGNSAPSTVSYSPEGFSPSDDGDGDDPVLKYIRQMLLEEDMEKKPHMLSDSLALHDTEKPFYDALGQNCPPPSPDQHPLYNQNFDIPDDNFSGGFSDYSSKSNTNLVDPSQYIGDLGEYNYEPSLQQTPLPVHYNSQPTLEADNSSSLFSSSYSLSNNNVNGGLVGGPVSAVQVQVQVPNFFSDSESALQFRRGVEEASKFLPPNTNLIIDLENYNCTSVPEQREVAPEVVVKAEEGEREDSPNGSRGRKREDIDLEDGRSNKQSAVYTEEAELSEMFDKVLLYPIGGKGMQCGDSAKEILQKGASKSLEQNAQAQGSSGGKGRAKKQGAKKEVVDLRTLLILCAQTVSAGDHRTATELLKQIRQHSSVSGDGSQRLAHCFANGLEARLNGTGTQLYTALKSKRTSAADILKAYHLYLQACPFKKIPIFFANKMILKAAEKATTIHLIDFGISYGFSWPILIQLLASLPGGPPKLRITGIEVPQPGFRPAAAVEESGRRLAKYCERFNVPFEYNAIAQNWETIQIEDLKLDSNDVLAVNCLYRFHSLLDETVVANSRRDAILSLIRKMKPDIFVHAVVNGSYNAPFFVTRFREAIFHFSALFDMFDATISRENEERLMFEKEFYGQQAMNVIACEDTERVERPETYKQWQVRTTRAGLQQLPLDQDVMEKLRTKLKAWYHKDFVIGEDGGWMLVGWKGRIVYATSCWAPS